MEAEDLEIQWQEIEVRAHICESIAKLLGHQVLGTHKCRIVLEHTRQSIALRYCGEQKEFHPQWNFSWPVYSNECKCVELDPALRHASHRMHCIDPVPDYTLDSMGSLSYALRVFKLKLTFAQTLHVFDLYLKGHYRRVCLYIIECSESW